MQEQIAAVTKFHEVYRIPYAKTPTVDISSSLISLRHRLMEEENEEYLQAAMAGDLVEVADALGDMLYILCGTMITHGMQGKMASVFNEIQRSNMSKLDENGAPIYSEDGKVMKGPNYFKPNIGAILAGGEEALPENPGK